MMTSPRHPRPCKLLSVDAASDRASMLIRKLAAEVSEQYIVIHCANAQRIEDVKSLASTFQPVVLLCASMWSPEQSDEIKKTAREAVPGLRCYAVPPGMEAERGERATIEHVKSKLPDVLAGDLGLA